MASSSQTARNHQRLNLVFFLHPYFIVSPHFCYMFLIFYIPFFFEKKTPPFTRPYFHPMVHPHFWIIGWSQRNLVGGFSPPLWKMMELTSVGMMNIPIFVESHKICSKPPTSYLYKFIMYPRRLIMYLTALRDIATRAMSKSPWPMKSFFQLMAGERTFPVHGLWSSNSWVVYPA